ncbi:putative uncharacterized protein [Firmicutes bacterium CAG:882]|nr:putative uncharacterized protein [Firmicutes bacterium CAG:882]
MHIERIHRMIECLTEKTLSELDKGIENVNVEEMSEAVDMIKDLCEAEYRAVIVKSMKKADEEEEEYNKELLRMFKTEYGEEDGRRFYDEYRYKTTGRYAPKGKGTYVGRRGYEEPPYWHRYPGDMTDMDYDSMERMRDMDRLSRGRMYFSDVDRMGMIDQPRSGSSMERDMREGRSGISRKHYMETKEQHKANTQQDKDAKMQSLDEYMRELSTDMTELLTDMTPEERTMLKNKMSVLMTKI